MTVECPRCGRVNTAHGPSCEHCGALLSSAADRSVVFERLRSSPEYRDRNSVERHSRLPKYSGFQKFALSGFFLLFIGISLFICVMAVGMAGAFGLIGFRVGEGLGAGFALIPLCMAVVPLAFIVIGVIALITVWKKIRAVEEAPVEALPVVVVDKRTHVSGGGETMVRTSYFATVETEKGSRKEYELWDGTLYALMTSGDAGILYVRAEHGLAFDRVA